MGGRVGPEWALELVAATDATLAEQLGAARLAELAAQGAALEFRTAVAYLAGGSRSPASSREVRGVGVDDRRELRGGGAVQDHAVAPEVELVADRGHALLGRARGAARATRRG